MNKLKTKLSILDLLEQHIMSNPVRTRLHPKRKLKVR